MENDSARQKDGLTIKDELNHEICDGCEQIKPYTVLEQLFADDRQTAAVIKVRCEHQKLCERMYRKARNAETQK